MTNTFNIGNNGYTETSYDYQRLNCPGYPPFPSTVVNCPTEQNKNTFSYYYSDADARKHLIDYQQGNDGGFSKSPVPLLFCNPPVVLIQNCMNLKSWTTMLTPVPGGGSMARFVYFTGIDQQSPNPALYRIYGLELTPLPAGGFNLSPLTEFGANICAVLPC
ncbi:hypothetical protein ACTFPA_07875 [Bacillus cereus group sp. MYBK59-1]|uniref:hypothetical protein n=1 Tax=Bacillus cereus group sp. MYBK59-1 TaxID=3450617 RepID=UPI003F78F73F